MNYEEAKIKAEERYARALREIELCNSIAQKIGPSLPEGWKMRICTVVFNLEITKGRSYQPSKTTDAGEFKLVCKLVETATGEKLNREAQAVNHENKLYFLRATKYVGDIDCSTGVEVHLYYPENMPDCKIKWKRRWTKEAVISDECLGIGQVAT